MYLMMVIVNLLPVILVNPGSQAFRYKPPIEGDNQKLEG